LALSGSGAAAAAAAGANAGGLTSARSTSPSPGRSNLANLLKRSQSGAQGSGKLEGGAGGASFSMSGTLDDRAQAAADLERYDKIAALIDSRTKGRSGSGASLGRLQSAKEMASAVVRQASFR
jgi:hypothetical protein